MFVSKFIRMLWSLSTSRDTHICKNVETKLFEKEQKVSVKSIFSKGLAIETRLCMPPNFPWPLNSFLLKNIIMRKPVNIIGLYAANLVPLSARFNFCEKVPSSPTVLIKKLSVIFSKAYIKGAQAWDIRSLRFSWFLHHKVFMGRWFVGKNINLLF
jgi:hypothetical protein